MQSVTKKYWSGIQLHTVTNSYTELLYATLWAVTLEFKNNAFFCENIFIVKITVTKYCGKKPYKARKRQENIDKVIFDPKLKIFKSTLQDKYFLSIDESASLIGVSNGLFIG